MTRCWTVALLLLTLGARAWADDGEIGWNKSFINGRRDAAAQGVPMVVLFFDRIQLDYYDDVLGKDPKVRAAQKGFVFIKVDREAEKDLARRLGVKVSWEVRILAPDLTTLKALGGKPKPAALADALQGLRKVWTSQGGPKGIDWIFSYDEALKQAREKTRPLMIYFWSDDVKGSSAEENAVCKNEHVIQMSKKFVCIKLNKTLDQELFDKYQIKDVPRILFVKPNEEACAPASDTVKIEAFVMEMKDVWTQFGGETVESKSGGG